MYASPSYSWRPTGPIEIKSDELTNMFEVCKFWINFVRKRKNYNFRVINYGIDNFVCILVATM